MHLFIVVGSIGIGVHNRGFMELDAVELQGLGCQVVVGEIGEFDSTLYQKSPSELALGYDGVALLVEDSGEKG